jgi:hypothetical protein
MRAFDFLRRIPKSAQDLLWIAHEKPPSRFPSRKKLPQNRCEGISVDFVGSGWYFSLRMISGLKTVLLSAITALLVLVSAASTAFCADEHEVASCPADCVCLCHADAPGLPHGDIPLPVRQPTRDVTGLPPVKSRLAQPDIFRPPTT